MCTVRRMIRQSVRSLESSSLTLSSVFGRARNQHIITALSSCESAVAIAAPATPILNVTTNSRSSTTFIRQQAMRKYSGCLESPTARRIAEPML